MVVEQEGEDNYFYLLLFVYASDFKPEGNRDTVYEINVANTLGSQSD